MTESFLPVNVYAADQSETNRQINRIEARLSVFEEKLVNLTRTSESFDNKIEIINDIHRDLGIIKFRLETRDKTSGVIFTAFMSAIAVVLVGLGVSLFQLQHTSNLIEKNYRQSSELVSPK
jgi:hypothetical protein